MQIADIAWLASCAFAKKEKDGNKMPQIIAHRGFRAKYPENTLLSFRSALDAGAQALETDVHITKDREVVLSHVRTLVASWESDAHRVYRILL